MFNHANNPHSFAYRDRPTVRRIRTAEPSLIRESNPHPLREAAQTRITHSRSWFMFKRTGALYFFRIGRLSGSFCWTARK